jgi:translation initiation factor 1 (eIF-1/SUI1)
LNTTVDFKTLAATIEAWLASGGTLENKVEIRPDEPIGSPETDEPMEVEN